MIRFLIKGLLRDKSRSRLPIIVVAIGVFLTVLLQTYIRGFMGDTLEINARFSYGHVKVMTQAYAHDMELLPNDLALLEAQDLLAFLETSYPDMSWAARIQFAGLVDVPDPLGETRSQGPALALGLDLLSPHSLEIQRLNLSQAIVRGNLPQHPGEVLISENFAQRLNLHPGEAFTLICSGMYGSLNMTNFQIAGTLSFGVEIMDRGTLIMDLEDARIAMDMEDAAGEILGFFASGFYDNQQAETLAEAFNAHHAMADDEFTPIMRSLSQQGTMGSYVKLVDVWIIYVSMIFVIAMALVLWNAGLLGGLRRYGEIGVRLAMGEEKGHVYRSMIYESFFIGLAGTIIGTTLSLSVSYIIQRHGINIAGLMEGASLMMPSVIRTRIMPVDFYIGLIPGLFSTVSGTMLAGIGIYRRQTARLFKELET